MKKNYQFFVGIDVSKEKLDYCIVSDATSSQHQFGIVSNTEKGIRQLLAALKKSNITKAETLFCLENTGVYSMPLCYWLQKNQFDYWVESALQIKRAKGISRGKNDSADAKDIALYAVAHLHLLKLSILPENDFIELRLLLAEREKLIKAIVAFKATRENEKFLPTVLFKTTLMHSTRTIQLLQKQLLAVEKSIQGLIDRNPVFKTQEKLLLTVPGIGKQTAANLIATTNAFTSFKNWRKFACYCGIAPFEYSSGSSIRKKTRVSHLADKKMKSLLNMAALTAKKTDAELKDYYDKKVKEGKNKMSVLNAIRCKIVSRAFAVIERNNPFVNITKFKAAA